MPFALLTIIMFKKLTFQNKTRLLLIPYHDTEAITILFLYGVGSRYERPEINGVSHFIEHLMFKGTNKRPTTLDISRDLDRVGAEFNAMTSKDYTGYYIKISQAHKDLAVDILSDMLLHSKFDAREINRERGVIVEEINMYHDNPIMCIESLFEEAVFAGNPLGADVAGPAAVIKKISRKQILAYRDNFYRPDNLVIAVAGKIDDALRADLEKKFIAKATVPSAPLPRFVEYATDQVVPRIKLQFKETKQVQLAFGFPAFGYHDKRAYALHLLSIILGGNMSSRLFVSVREKRGLCYFIRCSPNFYQDTGNLMIQSGLDKSRLDEALAVIQAELVKVKKQGVTAKELRDAKEFLRGKIVLALEDSSNLAEFFAKQELLLGKILTPTQKMKKYAAVTLGDIQAVAREVFQPNRANIAIIGPFKEEKYFRKRMDLWKNF